MTTTLESDALYAQALPGPPAHDKPVVVGVQLHLLGAELQEGPRKAPKAQEGARKAWEAPRSSAGPQTPSGGPEALRGPLGTQGPRSP